MRSLLIVAAVVGACALGGAYTPAKQQPDRLPDLVPAKSVASATTLHGITKAPFAQLPATSCAAAACHGAGEVGKLGSEYSTWAPEVVPPAGQSDPHSKAYRVLFNEVSVRMGQILKLEPHKDRRCLTCHSVETGGDATVGGQGRDQILAEGVGCSGCHGPAEKWISQHYLPEWQTLSNEKKWKEYGFLPTKNVVSRTLNCVSCHVGDADREVNHDLIAAGHPRLAFEAARFHYQTDYRKHWTEKTPQPDFEIRLWIVGQVATLRAAAKLLEARAERSVANDPKSVWPEFAGLSCYACHQRIGDEAIRAVAGASTRPAGVPGWEIWSNTALGIAAEYCEAAYPGLTLPELKSARAAIDELRSTMDAKRTPPPAKVKAQAAKAVEELDKCLLALQNAEDQSPKPLPKTTSERLARAMTQSLAANALSKDKTDAGGKPLLADHDWDSLAANYLGCAAMYHATREADRTAPPPAWGGPVEALRDKLRFPIVPNSAKGRKEFFNSPADLTQQKLFDLRNLFSELRDATGGKN